MANINAPFGFDPIDPIREWSTDTFIVTAGQTIYKGDPVKRTNAGTVSVGAAADGDAYLGIAAEKVDDSASAGGKKIIVITDLNMRYKVQCKTGRTAALTDVFNTADIATYAAPTGARLASGQSVCALDTPGTSNLTFEILGLYDDPVNAWGDSAVVVVRSAKGRAATASAYPGI